MQDFSQPLECLARDLPVMIAAARAAGWDAHHMIALPEVLYRLHFWKSTPPRAIRRPRRATRKSKESFLNEQEARRLNTPDTFYESPKV